MLCQLMGSQEERVSSQRTMSRQGLWEGPALARCGCSFPHLMGFSTEERENEGQVLLWWPKPTALGCGEG